MEKMEKSAHDEKLKVRAQKLVTDDVRTTTVVAAPRDINLKVTNDRSEDRSEDQSNGANQSTSAVAGVTSNAPIILPPANFFRRVQASLIDNGMLAVAGMLISMVSTFLLTLPFIHLTLPAMGALAGASVLVGFLGLFLYGLYSTIPIVWCLGAVIYQLRTHQTFGAFIILHFCGQYVRPDVVDNPLFWIASAILTFVLTLLPGILAPLYHSFMESSARGATFGKLIAGTAVKGLNGERITFGRAIVRQLAAILSSFYFIGFLFGLIGKRITLHDLITKTRVVSTGEKFVAASSAATAARSLTESVLIRYNARPALARWIRQRFDWTRNKKASKRKQLIMLVSLPFAIVCGYGGLGLILSRFLPDFAKSLSPGRLGMHAGGDPVATSLNILVLFGFVFSLGVFLLLLANKLGKEPKNVLLTPEKLGLGASHDHSFKYTDSVLWTELQNIALERSGSSGYDSVISFHRTSGNPVKVKLASLESIEDKEKLLHAIEKWAPAVPRDAAVVEALQPPADHSYTEVWLQALTAPPKRERLKPLATHAVLQDGHYEVSRALGAGGQCHAYLAADKTSNSDVVLKEFILPVFVEMSVRKASLENFEREGKILKQLDHDQVVKLLDFFVEDHRAYLVLEHIDGDNLRRLVKENGKMSESQVRGLAYQMCDILQYLHSLSPPVVHRDFTPDNLILRKDGTLKLIDFNVAQDNDSGTTGTVVGKHAFLPPEQFQGLAVPASDIYALGATLFYLLTGQDPEPITTSHPILLEPGVSGELDSLVANATALKLAVRYKSAQDVRRALDQPTNS